MSTIFSSFVARGRISVSCSAEEGSKGQGDKEGDKGTGHLSIGFAIAIFPARMPRMKRLIILLCAFISLMSCKQKSVPVPITGQVFIVMKNRENVKLGLVPISIYTAEAFNQTHKRLIAKVGQSYVTRIIQANLPSPLASVKTDADGKFQINSIPKGEYVIVADAEREIRGESETYYWFVPVKVTNSPVSVILSNDNMTL